MEEKRIYSINDVAQIMGLTLKVVRRYVASGELRTTKNNNTYCISGEDFINFKSYIEEGGDVKHMKEVADSFRPGTQLGLFKEMEFETPSNNTKSRDRVNWVDINKYWDSPNKSKMTFVDLFCGAGGLTFTPQNSTTVFSLVDE